ncbi:NAD(P)/FAD-dependent oxidoreductase [Nocardioides okcheonensis]|uniref:NAD(P)/FAD-dependent oxidoreductase n=1 Tax=Nocardioides okcheonensis TaxID=2894081 RepID=UPI001E5ABF48|nr:NAD(P)-binding protein [Nocardioides okcheonensis]UFN43907.1 NAD(P)-binding protein [Nocardioides okcheonensis]
MSDVVVVGAGLAGVACARELRAAGIAVRVLDRGRVPGGRMASRTLWERRVDLGASYFTVSDEAFGAVVDDWAARDLAREWTDTFCALGDGEPEAKSGPVRWGATHGLRTLVEDLAADLDVERKDLTDLSGLGEVVVLAMPDPQARRLVGAHPVAEVLTRTWEPVLALAARWPSRTWDGVSPTGRFDGAFVNDDPTLAWVADDGRRRGDDAPVLVAHSTPGFASGHLDDPAAAGPAMVAALRRVLDLPEPEDVHVHRWTFARPTGERDEPFGLVEGDRLVGVCGDGWGSTPKVETAWLSGVRLGRALAARLGGG